MRCDQYNSNLSGVIFNIQRYAIHDGPGIRTTVFSQGCPMHCWWCHNPESQPLEQAALSGTHGGIITPGRCLTGAEVMREIEKDVLFFDESEGGVTFSGGEPLMQPEFLNTLLCLCAAQDIHTAVDTCGYAPPEIFQAVLEHVDLVLYDLKIIDDAAHQRYTGVSNRLVLDNLHVLSESGVPYYVRVPVIPSITDTRANIDAMLMLLDKRHGIQQVNLLPYHRTAAHKYAQLRQEYRMAPVDPPSEARLQVLKKTFEAHGFNTIIGG